MQHNEPRELTDYELKVVRTEKDRFIDFIDDFVEVITALNRDPIYVEPPKELLGSKTHNDMEAAIVNKLTHLPRFTALARLPKGEYTIKTNQSGSMHLNVMQRKREQILDYTRDQYTKTREEVDQEMAERIKPDEPPTTTKRRGTV